MRESLKQPATVRNLDWLLEKIRRDQPLSPAEALAILDADNAALPLIFTAATEARQKKFGDRAILCSILNARSGRCGEDCAFCAQSAHHNADVVRHSFLSDDEILSAYRAAATLPIARFGVVTSGRGLNANEVARLAELFNQNRAEQVAWCASLGELDEAALRLLRCSGLKRYHHNLETAASYFPRVCSTHAFADRVNTIKAAQRAGLEVCAGGILGLGESPAQRVELAFSLRELDVDSVPLNFLVPIPGTPLAEAPPLRPEEILKAIAMFKLVCREAEIRVCAGREAHLGAREADIFAAGATGIMIGGYLTVCGRAVEDDLDMLASAGMKL